MAEQAEAGDIGAGVYCLAMGLQLIQQSVLTVGHVLEHGVQSLGLAGTRHGSSEQHAGAQGTTQQQHITVGDSPLAPGGSAATVDAEAQLHSQAGAVRRFTAGFQGVSSDQLRLLLLQHRSHTAQRLHQQFLLLRRLQHRQGHDRLGAVDPGTAGPEIGAGMQGGESPVQPGVTHQRREPIHALQ